MEQVFYIDLKGITTKEALQERVAQELPVPEYYGKNLDALYDVLTEQGEAWNIIFYNCDESAECLAKLRRMCADACDECDGLRVRFF